MALDFTKAYKYPFRRWVGLLNILWLLVPVYGWFLLIGYKVRIINEFLVQKWNKLPEIRHGSDFTLGWLMFWKGFPAMAALIAAASLFGLESVRLGSWSMLLFTALALLIVPILSINFLKKQRVSACFEFDLVRVVFHNFEDYVIALFNELALGMIWLVMAVILVGIPSAFYMKNVFMAEFYRTHVK